MKKLKTDNSDIQFGYDLAQASLYLYYNTRFSFKVKKEHRPLVSSYLNNFGAIYFYEQDKVKIIGYLNYN